MNSIKKLEKICDRLETLKNQTQIRHSQGKADKYILSAYQAVYLKFLQELENERRSQALEVVYEQIKDLLEETEGPATIKTLY